MRRTTYRALVGLCAVLFAIVLQTTPAAGQPAKDTASAHVGAGSRAARAKDWVTAADEYGRAIALTPTAVAYYGLASALDELGKLPDAFTAYGNALAQSPALPP